VRWRWPDLPFARRPAPAGHARFGFAVVGLGHGADKFLHALRDSELVRVTALVSGDAQKAARLARRFDVPRTYSYTSFDRLADDPAVDAVYLCLPNARHREFTERAARAGKHVLCEKPLAPASEDAEAMLAACRAAKRLLAVGYRLPFTSVHTRARQLLASGQLGEVQAVRAGFGFVATPGWRLDPTQTGTGSLFDVGIYAVSALHDLLPSPFRVEHAQILRNRDGVEHDLAWQGRLQANGAGISCRSSFIGKIPDHFEVQATRATLLLQPAFSYTGLRLQVRAHAAADRALDLDYRTPGDEASAFRLEAEHLAHCARGREPLRNDGANGLRDLRVLEEILHHG
jgi:predicted dehydrogenase